MGLRGELWRVLRTWLLLLGLGAAELGASYLPLARTFRPLLMIPGIFMLLAVLLGFMEVRKGPVIVRGFAIAALFWLLILLGLGSMDPLTRTEYHVSTSLQK